MTRLSGGTPNFASISPADFIASQSDLLPMMIATSGVSFDMAIIIIRRVHEVQGGHVTTFMGFTRFTSSGGSRCDGPRELRATGYGPRTTGHGPRTTDHGPRTTDHGPRTTRYDE